MNHFNVLSTVLLLMVGVWSIFSFQQKMRPFGDLGLHSFWHFLILFNVFQLEYFLYIYFFNVLFPVQTPTTILLKEIGWPLRTLLILGLFIFQFRMVSWQRGEEKPTPWITFTLILFTIAMFFFFLLGFQFPKLLPTSPILSYWNMLVWPMNIWLIIELIRLLQKSHNQKDIRQQAVIRFFAWLLLGHIAMQLLVFLLHTLNFFIWELSLAKLLILYTNLLPLYWLKTVYTPWAGSLTKIIHQNVDMTFMKKIYGLSDREFEILGLMVDGKSYKEIENQLFISIHTVKSHVYNLYRKMGINSRHQLIHKLTTDHQAATTS